MVSIFCIVQVRTACRNWVQRFVAGLSVCALVATANAQAQAHPGSASSGAPTAPAAFTNRQPLSTAIAVPASRSPAGRPAWARHQHGGPKLRGARRALHCRPQVDVRPGASGRLARAPVLQFDEFARLRSAVEARFGPEIQALALAWTVPYRVECNAITGALTWASTRPLPAQLRGIATVALFQ
jgi:hypothetical protein